MKRMIKASVGLFFLAVASCGGSPNTTPGTGGSNATAGTTGTAGSSATGSAGTSGDAGTSGSAGTTGTAGASATGTAGTSGDAGTSGSAGATGGSSPTGTAGTEGGTTGTAGRGGMTGNAGRGGTTGGGGGGATGNAGRGGTTGGGGGGATGTAGRGGTTGTGGATAGTTGTGGTGGSATLTITSTQFGAFDNAFMITPCMGTGSGYDCPNLPMGMTSCPATAWSYGSVTTTEGTGNTYTEVFNVSGGDPTKIYDITIHVLGQAEGRTYTGGTRALSGNVDPSAATNNLLYTGGQPGTTRVDYNVFQLVITPGTGGTAVAGAPTYFAFNAVDSTHEGNHYNYGIDETFVAKVKSGFTMTLTSHDSNCIAIKNCGPGGPYNFANASACEAVARSTPASVTLPTTFRSQTISSPTKFQTQFLNFKVMSIVAE